MKVYSLELDNSFPWDDDPNWVLAGVYSSYEEAEEQGLKFSVDYNDHRVKEWSVE
jgi:hypothetical protein